VITGDVGAGKTVSVRAAVDALDRTRHQVIYIANPAFGTRGLYVTIVRSLGAEPRYLKAELMAQAADLLAAETPNGTAGSYSYAMRPTSSSPPSSKSCGS
jgi:type II secretory pathway predicted ATPase ExeA